MSSIRLRRPQFVKFITAKIELEREEKKRQIAGNPMKKPAGLWFLLIT